MTDPRTRRLLVAESDPALRRMISRRLTREGYDVISLDHPNAVAEKLPSVQPDLVVLEVGGAVGFEPLLSLREVADVAVIVVLWAEAGVDEVAVLDLGADDCLVRPLSIGNLAARIRAVLRRVGPPPATTLYFDQLDIDLAARMVRVDGRVVELPPREFDLLAFLACHPGEVFRREQLLTHVWKSSAGWQQLSTVTEHIHRIRLHVEADPARPRWLLTVRGVGYRFADAPRAG